MSVIQIASRYAKSLIELSTEQGKLERVLKDIEALSKAVANRDLYLLLKSPIVHGDKKLQILKAIFDKHFDKLTMEFIRTIVSKGREDYLPEMAHDFISQHKRLNEVTTVKLTTATPVDKKTVEAILAKLEKSKETGKKVDITTAVNPELLGGFILELENKRYDASVAYQLEQLKKEFTGNIYTKKF